MYKSSYYYIISSSWFHGHEGRDKLTVSTCCICWLGVVTPPIGLTLWADLSEEDTVSDTNPKYIAAQLTEFKRIRSEKHI